MESSFVKQQFNKRFESELSKLPFISDIETKFHIPKTYSASGLTLVYLTLVYLNIGGLGQLFSNIATCVIPGYYSLVALETPGTADDTQLLTYWVVYAAFTIIEFWSGALTYWIPAYWLLKTILFLWLGLPALSGSKYVYNSFLRSVAINYLGIKPGRPVAKGATSTSTSSTSKDVKDQ